MKREDFINLLKNQIEGLSELLSIVTHQQGSLVNSNYDTLNENVKSEEDLFNKLNTIQSLIKNEMFIISEKENLGLKEFKLSEFLKFLPENDPDYKIIKSAQTHIVNLVREISRLNFQNGFLIDHSREMIKEIITKAAANKNAIFDRRI